MIPSMAYAPQPTIGQMDQPKAQIQLTVMMDTARSIFKFKFLEFLILINL